MSRIVAWQLKTKFQKGLLGVLAWLKYLIANGFPWLGLYELNDCLLYAEYLILKTIAQIEAWRNNYMVYFIESVKLVNRIKLGIKS